VNGQSGAAIVRIALNSSDRQSRIGSSGKTNIQSHAGNTRIVGRTCSDNILASEVDIDLSTARAAQANSSVQSHA
jgi:hypothetical protein